MEEYKTVFASGTDEFTEKRSRFIGNCVPVSSEEEALAFVKSVKSEHWDARHNVYAYIIREGQIMRYSDDGEPQGTAGIPVLEVLKKSGVCNVAVVVTRYFGGILLGAGGLVRAYSHTASIALQASKPIYMRECLNCRIRCSYTQYGRISSLIPEMDGFLDNTVYNDAVELYFHITEAKLNSLNKELAEITAGSVKSEIGGKQFYPFEL